jgi:kynurenine formamidase
MFFDDIVDRALDEEARSTAPGTAALVGTDQDVRWGSDGSFTERPHVTSQAAQWLADKEIGMFCKDLIVVDNPAQWSEPSHNAFLCRAVPLVQQLDNMGRLVAREFTPGVLPLATKGGTASPVRRVALLHR